MEEEPSAFDLLAADLRGGLGVDRGAFVLQFDYLLVPDAYSCFGGCKSLALASPVAGFRARVYIPTHSDGTSRG